MSRRKQPRDELGRFARIVKTARRPVKRKKAPARQPVKAAAKPKARGHRPEAKTPVRVVAKLKGRRSEAKAPVKAAAKPKAKAPVKAVAKPQAKPPAKAAAKPQAKAPVKAVAKPQAKAPVKAVAKPQAKPPAKAAAKPQAKPPAKAAAKPKAKAPVKAVAKPKPKAPVKAVAKPKPKAPVKAVAKPKPKGRRPEAKAPVKAAAKPPVKPLAKPPVRKRRKKPPIRKRKKGPRPRGQWPKLLRDEHGRFAPRKKPPLPPRPPRPPRIPKKPELPLVAARSHEAEEEMLAKLLSLQDLILLDEAGLDMAVQTMINLDGTVDGELTIRNLPDEWRDARTMGLLVATLSSALRTFVPFQAHPVMGGGFWCSFGVRFGPQNEAEIGEMYNLYKRHRGLFQIGTYPTPAWGTGALQIALVGDNVGLKAMLTSLMKKRGLPPSVVMIRFIWTPDGQRPGHYKGEK